MLTKSEHIANYKNMQSVDAVKSTELIDWEVDNASLLIIVLLMIMVTEKLIGDWIWCAWINCIKRTTIFGWTKPTLVNRLWLIYSIYIPDLASMFSPWTDSNKYFLQGAFRVWNI